MELEGKKAIVTGASRGIGKAIALALAEAGANVACVARSTEAVAETVAAIRGLGRKAEPYAVDVSDTTAVESLVDRIATEFDGIDLLINNAGVTRDTLLIRMSSSDWDAVLNTNLKGAFNWTKPVARILLRQRSGRIVNIASVIGLIGNAGQANYAASKAGLIGFTKSVARELAPRGVTVNAICPGFIETDMTSVLSDEVKARVLPLIPLQRYGQAHEIAALTTFLCGPRGAYITGQALAVDGGMTM